MLTKTSVCHAWTMDLGSREEEVREKVKDTEHRELRSWTRAKGAGNLKRRQWRSVRNSSTGDVNPERAESQFGSSEEETIGDSNGVREKMEQSPGINKKGSGFSSKAKTIARNGDREPESTRVDGKACGGAELIENLVATTREGVPAEAGRVMYSWQLLEVRQSQPTHVLEECTKISFASTEATPFFRFSAAYPRNRISLLGLHSVSQESRAPCVSTL